MLVILNRKAFISALPDMAAGAIMPMVAANMAGHEPLHEFVEMFRLLRLYKQMKMVWHQTPGAQPDRKSFPRLLHNFREGQIVAILVEYLLSTIAPVDDVIKAVIGQCA